jgi:hypothetical protein
LSTFSFPLNQIECTVVTTYYSPAIFFTAPFSKATPVYVPQKSLSNPYAVVKNENSAVIGQIIGDIIMITITLPTPYLTVDKLCLPIISNLPFYDSDYSEVDLGMKVEDHFNPLGLTNFTYIEFYNVSLVCFQGVVITNGSIYAPIHRYHDYLNVQSLYMSQKSVLMTTSVLYILGVVLVVILSTRIPKLTHLLAIEIQCALLLLFRAAYFLLLFIEILPKGQGFLDYMLSEIPSFMYFVIVLQVMHLSFVFEDNFDF